VLTTCDERARVQAYVKEGSEGELSRTVFVRDSGEVSLSVLFIYEEYKQTDFIKEFSLEETFIDHLAMMFPSLIYTPVSETGETVSVAPSPWDEKKVHSALCLPLVGCSSFIALTPMMMAVMMMLVTTMTMTIMIRITSWRISWSTTRPTGRSRWARQHRSRSSPKRVRSRSILGGRSGACCAIRATWSRAFRSST
jgi:hypothetical protein